MTATTFVTSGSRAGIGSPVIADTRTGKTYMVADLGAASDPVTAVNVSITGVAATGAVGSFNTQHNATITGVAATGAVGALTTSSTGSPSITGVAGLGQVGSLTDSFPGNPSITGVAGLGQVGGLVTTPNRNTLSLVSLYPIAVSTSEYALVGVAGANFPATFSQFSFSAWCCESVNIQMPDGFATPNLQMALSPTLISINITDASNQTLFTGVWSNPWPTRNEYQVLFSVDTIAQVYTLYVSNQLWTPQGVSFPHSGLIHNNLTVLPTDVSITGVTATGQVGSVTVLSNRQVNLTGVAATAQLGTLLTKTEKPLSGVAAAGQVGTINIHATLTGVAATAQVGTLLAETDAAMRGVAATGQVGTPSTTGNQLISVVGVAATGQAGTLRAEIDRVLSGVSATGHAGSLNIPVRITGVAGTGQVGILAGVVAPAQAAAAGFNTLVFNDDFTSAATIFSTITSTPQAGVNWYCSNAGGVSQTSPTAWQLFPTTFASGISNGNSGGGSFASKQGGIWEIKGISGITNNWNFQTVSNSQVGANAWKHMYWEAYVQFDASESSPGGWPAWWSMPENIAGVPTGAQVNVMEAGLSNNTSPASAGASKFNVYDPFSGMLVLDVAHGDVQNPVDSNWHVYGCLWQSTGAGTGTLDFYFDNVHVAGPFTTGSGGTVPDMESGTGQLLILGTGAGIPIFVDWVRVWQ